MNLSRLRARRDQLGFTQADLAEAVGVEKGTYYRYEKGELDPPAKVIELASRKLEVSSDWLLGLVEGLTEHLHEEVLSPEERQLIAAVRSGELEKAVITAMHLANNNH